MIQAYRPGAMAIDVERQYRHDAGAKRSAEHGEGIPAKAAAAARDFALSVENSENLCRLNTQAFHRPVERFTTLSRFP
jgi:hypothetical protein